MVDILDDLIKEFKTQKKDFIKSVKAMQSIKESGVTEALNSRFKNVGDSLKIRFLASPIRDGFAGDRPKYTVMATDVTDVDAGDAPSQMILTQFHMQQVYRDLLSTRILKDPIIDKKLKCSVGTVWNVDAVETTFKGEGRKKDFMLQFNLVPEESVMDADAAISEAQASEVETGETGDKVNLQMT